MTSSVSLPRKQNTVWLDVSMDDVIVVAVLQCQDDLANVVAADGLAVHEAGCGTLHNLEAQVSTGHELEDHVQHTLRAERVENGIIL